MTGQDRNEALWTIARRVTTTLPNEVAVYNLTDENVNVWWRADGSVGVFDVERYDFADGVIRARRAAVEE